jgi:hypothetical protein
MWMTPQQYQGVLELEQETWTLSKWRNPVAEGVSPSPSSPASQDEVSSLEEASDSEDGPGSCPYDNTYVKQLLESADLHILQPGAVNTAFEGAEKELGLFHLFFTKNYLETVCKWTTEVQVAKGKNPCSIKELYAFIGLELGMSLLKFNDIKKNWAEIENKLTFFNFKCNVCKSLIDPLRNAPPQGRPSGTRQRQSPVQNNNAAVGCIGL